jgi:hypothetical protein
VDGEQIFECLIVQLNIQVLVVFILVLCYFKQDSGIFGLAEVLVQLLLLLYDHQFLDDESSGIQLHQVMIQSD